MYSVGMPMTQSDRITVGSLRIEAVFHRFVEDELLPAIGFDASTFWSGVEAIVDDLTPVNRDLLRIRAELQVKIDEYHKARAGQAWVHDEYVGFLRDIGYLKNGETFAQIDTANVDAEISEIAGPQLVVPVSNARFAINAANARWGSLYDALYGTNVIPEDDGQDRGASYNAARGAAVIQYAARFLDAAVQLKGVSHRDVNAYGITKNDGVAELVVSLANGETATLIDPSQFVGYQETSSRCSYLFRNNGLHIEIVIDPEHPIGKDAPASVADVILESAVTTIQDCEDSVAAVDAEDKVGVYRNWLGLMRGDLVRHVQQERSGNDSLPGEGSRLHRRGRQRPCAFRPQFAART